MAKQSCRYLSLHAVAIREAPQTSMHWYHGLLLWLPVSRSHRQRDQQMLDDILSQLSLAVSLEDHKCTGLQRLGQAYAALSPDLHSACSHTQASLLTSS